MTTALAVLGSLAVVWLALLAALWVGSRRGSGDLTLVEALRLVPDVLRLLRRLAGDRTLPRRTRLLVVLLIAYLASPIDLVPDFIPVIGYADDVVVVGWALRSVVRAAGPDALDAHWPGTPAGLAAVRRLAGVAAGRP